jgi:dTDP-glucose 4,6-dehydratase
MKRALVIGGAGFIGSHLCERLLADGHEVVALDNFITGNIKNVEHLKSSKFEFIEQNICTKANLPGKFDYVLNFASPASPVDYMEKPIETLEVGSIGTQNALEIAKANNAVFLMASTSEIYGDPAIHPQKEGYWGNVNSIGPRSCYDEAKRFSEAITMAYLRYHNVNTRIIRIFNTFGPRMRLRDGRVVPNFMVQALTSQPLTVFGEGNQTRSFCYVSDLVDGIVRLLEVEYHNPVNLGNPAEMTILEFAKKIKALTGASSEIIFKPLPTDDPKQRKPDISLAWELLQWKPVVSLDEGLEKTVAWFKEAINQ